MPVEPGSEEQMADRRAVASGEGARQHDENRMRDINVSERGSETATLSTKKSQHVCVVKIKPLPAVVEEWCFQT